LPSSVVFLEKEKINKYLRGAKERVEFMHEGSGVILPVTSNQVVPVSLRLRRAAEKRKDKERDDLIFRRHLKTANGISIGLRAAIGG
jgi:hypothetical protein